VGHGAAGSRLAERQSGDYSGTVNADDKKAPEPEKADEIGGPKGPEPTRYGDWERNGRVSDF
jgi:hypothetical protein